MLKFFSSTKSFTIHKRLEDSAMDTRAAIRVIGELDEKEISEPHSLMLKGRSFYGMQRVALTVELKRRDAFETAVSITGKCDDFRAVAATKCIERLTEAIEASVRGNIPAGFAADRDSTFAMKTGFTRGKLFAIMLAFTIGMLLLFFFISTSFHL